jgi:methylmalonyl-CoA mutase C-terminal domain/subunit
MERKIRVLVGKPGLDGHDRGAKVVAAALRDAGMEVIYTGLHQTPEQIVEAAIQEDVDVVALSVLSGAHMTLFPEVRRGMIERGVGDKLLTGGGIIPAEDMEALARQGVGRLFGPGSSTQEIAAYIRSWCEESRPVPAPEAKARAPKPRARKSSARAQRPGQAKSGASVRQRAKPKTRAARKRPLGKAVRGVASPGRPPRSRARERR